MKKYTLLIFVFILFFNSSSWAFDLKAGDIILISFNCYECRVIESETNSKFSHSGVVVKSDTTGILVGQSIGKVALYPLKQFLKPVTPNSAISVYRPKEFLNLSAAEHNSLQERMIEAFNLKFVGAPFDEKFLWNNFDEKGRELLYCSEFVAKFLDLFLETATIPYPLSYKKNEAYWLKYFKGVIPEGELGNSPAAFSRDDRFLFLGNL